LIVLAEKLPLIERLQKISWPIPRPNFPVDKVHSEGDSVKFASPKSGFPSVDEDMGYSHDGFGETEY
jgi:hypothetical protein